MRTTNNNRLSVSTLVLLLLYSGIALAQIPTIGANNNEEPAGNLRGNVLTISLVAEEGNWYPGGEGSTAIPIIAFREETGVLQTPGPLIRVTSDTVIQATIRNAVPGNTLEFHGFETRPVANATGLRIPTGESRTLNFSAGAPGVYFYWGALEGSAIGQRRNADSQLAGTFVVDPLGFTGKDEILVLGEYVTDPAIQNAAQFSINGRSWPHTERYNVTVGETNVWHLINPAFAGHPLHMHGFHYRVAAEGSHLQYQTIPPDQQREVVTELVGAGEVATIEWEAVREGNWLFHCHIGAHVDGANMISVRGFSPDDYDPKTMDMMSGMVVGIRASGRIEAAPTTPTRQLSMQLEHRDGFFGDNPGFGIAFNEKGKPKNNLVTPGPVLILNKNETVSIDVVNNLRQPTSIHWHGMELESYYDGVAGYSGLGTSITPPVSPGEVFRVLMTPPRAGTFIYHTHLHDSEQLSAGLYGAMIVSDPANPFNPELDRVFVVGLLGETNPTGLRFEGVHAGINGSTAHEQQFRMGQQYRLRIINITDNNAGFAFWLNGRDETQQWMPVAQDGAALPIGLRKLRPAEAQVVSVGETFDFLWTPSQPGPYWLEMRRNGNLEFMAQALLDVLPQ